MNILTEKLALLREVKRLQEKLDEWECKPEWIKEQQKLLQDRRMLEAENEILAEREACLKKYGEIEHDYHSAKEKRGIELAKLDALIANNKTILENQKINWHTEDTLRKELVKHKDEEISRLNDIIKNLTAQLGQIAKSVVKVTTCK